MLAGDRGGMAISVWPGERLKSVLPTLTVDAPVSAFRKMPDPRPNTFACTTPNRSYQEAFKTSVLNVSQHEVHAIRVWKVAPRGCDLHGLVCGFVAAAAGADKQHTCKHDHPTHRVQGIAARGLPVHG